MLTRTPLAVVAGLLAGSTLAQDPAGTNLYEDWWLDLQLGEDETTLTFTIQATSAQWMGMIMGTDELTPGTDAIFVEN